jgi:hypothetical protein
MTTIAVGQAGSHFSEIDQRVLSRSAERLEVEAIWRRISRGMRFG